jgi:uncharacterized surface protein with fasciclin (FAS1) repeats
MKTNKIKFLSVIAVIATLFTGCSDDDTKDTTITGLASSTSDLSILVQALNKAGLASILKGAGPFTVFAPDNDAFEAAGFTSEFISALPQNDEGLKQLLLNHVISGAVQSTALVNNTYVKTLGKGAASSTNTLSMHIKVAGTTVTLNGGAQVIDADIIAENGVIHIVDEVIALPTIVTHATANSNFTRLVGALTSAGQPNFVSILSGTGPYTVFAPTNGAFDSLDTELAAISFVPSTAQLTSVLQYHVVNGNVLAAAIPGIVSGPTAGVVETLNTQDITFSVTGGAKITGTFSPTRPASNIVATDVQCSNGVIHVLDKVLLPTL